MQSTTLLNSALCRFSLGVHVTEGVEGEKWEERGVKIKGETGEEDRE